MAACPKCGAVVGLQCQRLEVGAGVRHSGPHPERPGMQRCCYCGRPEYEQGWGCHACGMALAADLPVYWPASGPVIPELEEIPRCEKCNRYPIDHRSGACIYPIPIPTGTIPERHTED